MTEPDVALTDYLLAVETALFCWLIWDGTPDGPLRIWSVLLFASLSLASLAGGTTHGFFLDEDSVGHRILWPLTLISIGVTALCLWVIAAELIFDPQVARVLTLLAAAAFVLYSLAVLLLTSQFLIAIVAYLPAVLFLLAVLAVLWFRTQERALLLGCAAIVLTLIASAIQQIDLSIPAIPRANNVLYHLLEAVAFLLLFAALSWISTQTSLPLQ